MHAPGINSAPFSGVVAAPGVYFKNEIFSYQGSANRIIKGGYVNTDVEAKALANIFRTTIVSDTTILGGQYAYAMAIPILNMDISATAELPYNLSKSYNKSSTDIGDITITPLILGWHSENLHSLFYTSIFIPTGEYETGLEANTGKNRWAIDAGTGLTYLSDKGIFEVSGLLGVIYNFENEDTNYKTGAEFHLDSSLTMALSKEWRAGLSGYIFKQLTADSGSGAVLGDFKGQVYGIGPQVLYSTKINEKPVSFGIRYMNEYKVKNRVDGETLIFSLSLAL